MKLLWTASQDACILTDAVVNQRLAVGRVVFFFGRCVDHRQTCRVRSRFVLSQLAVKLCCNVDG